MRCAGVPVDGSVYPVVGALMTMGVAAVGEVLVLVGTFVLMVVCASFDVSSPPEVLTLVLLAVPV